MPEPAPLDHGPVLRTRGADGTLAPPRPVLVVGLVVRLILRVTEVAVPAENDIGLEIARRAATDGLEDFKATLAFFQDNPNPDPRKRPTGGVAMPQMGRKQPANPGKPGKSGPSRRELQKWEKEAEKVALREMMIARRDFVPSLFSGARVQYKAGRTPAQEARSAAQSFGQQGLTVAQGAANDVREGRSAAPTSSPAKTVSDPRTLGKKVFQALGHVDPGELAGLESTITDLAGDLFSDLGSSILPLVGTAKAGANAASGWTKTGKKQAQVRKAKKSGGKLVQGDPAQAIAGVKRLLERERNLLAGEASLATAKLGSDLAGYFVDLGIASSVVAGCAEAVGRLALHVRQIVRDAREMKAANELLNGGRIDARIFTECPLLGAYAVAAADTSALVGFLGGDPQRHGFTLDDLEKLVRKYQQPMVSLATDLIRASRLEVTGMPTDRATARAKAEGQARSIGQKAKTKVKQALQRANPRR